MAILGEPRVNVWQLNMALLNRDHILDPFTRLGIAPSFAFFHMCSCFNILCCYQITFSATFSKNSSCNCKGETKSYNTNAVAIIMPPNPAAAALKGVLTPKVTTATAMAADKAHAADERNPPPIHLTSSFRTNCCINILYFMSEF